MYKNIIDKDWLMICQDDTCPSKIRLSWFKDNHYQCEKFIDLKLEEYHKHTNMDWYHAGYGLYVNVYFTHNNRYISFDYDCNGEYIYKSYELAELFESATT